MIEHLGGNAMSERAWFIASSGKQEGPLSDAQFRALVASGQVTADTLVWSEGMVEWVRASNVPGLMSAAPPAVSASSGAVQADFGVWELFGWGLLVIIGTMLIIPAPWVMTGFYRWVIAHIRVPQRPNLAFTGQVGDIWYVFILTALASYAGLAHIWYLPYLLMPIEAFLAWLVIKWLIGNISSDGAHLPLSFLGSVWAYIGWYVLLNLSIFTIIGWAWVTTAWLRWICRNIAGTQREVFFNGSGWQVLWRSFVYVLTCIFIIPIPWMTRWYARWYVSQFSVGAPIIS
jgi:hypothetical protein